MEKRIDKIEEQVDLILQNHLPHITESLSKISVNVDWLMKFFWIIATASIGSLLAAILGLVIK